MGERQRPVGEQTEEVGERPVPEVTTGKHFDEDLQWGNAGSIVDVAIVTAAVLPFVKSLATAAGQQSFEVARGIVRRTITRGSTDSDHDLLDVTVKDTDKGLQFVVPDGLPDDALLALACTNLEKLAAPDPSGKIVTIRWTPESNTWQRHVFPR